MTSNLNVHFKFSYGVSTELFGFRHNGQKQTTQLSVNSVIL